jgi:hypothetical protein
MAQISINFDTNSKECSVTIDGVAIGGVDYVSISAYEGCNGISITTKSEKVDGMRIYSQVTANSKYQGSNTVKKTGNIGGEKEFTIAQVTKSDLLKSFGSFRNTK